MSLPAAKAELEVADMWSLPANHTVHPGCLWDPGNTTVSPTWNKFFRQETKQNKKQEITNCLALSLYFRPDFPNENYKQVHLLFGNFPLVFFYWFLIRGSDSEKELKRNVWQIAFPKMAVTTSPIPHAFLKCILATPLLKVDLNSSSFKW